MTKETLSRRNLLALGVAATAAAGCATAADGQTATNTRLASGSTGAGETPGVITPTAIIQTTNGPVQGQVDSKGVHTFTGLRYGEAPIGKLRFMPPKPPKPWTGTHEATGYGAPAMQMAGETQSFAASDFSLQLHQVFSTPSELKIQNEDCLWLNVWTPATDGKKRPVMFWIHGGGFSYGSGGQPIYQGDGLADFGDVVVVSVNHRLNVFGYAHLANVMGSQFASSGSAGMQDLVLSLEWVRDNIAAFGGDPDNVTIMGQSGGGAKVCCLLSMPSAKGLFHKASIQSGPGLRVGDPEAADKEARALLKELDISVGDIRALQAVPAPHLIAAARKVNDQGRAFGRPIVDGVAITQHPYVGAAPAMSADVPLLVGWCKDEMTLFTAGAPWFGRMTEDDLQKMLAPMGEAGQTLANAYREAYPDYSPTYIYEAVISGRMQAGSEVIAAMKSAQGSAPAYVWQMNWETPVLGGAFKSPHCMEIPFMMYSFDKARAFVGPGDAPKRMADQIAGAWVAFARSGSPNGPGLPQWDAYARSSRPIMMLEDTCHQEMNPLPGIASALAKAGPALTSI